MIDNSIQNSPPFNPAQLIFQFCSHQALDFSSFYPGNNQTLYDQLHQLDPSKPNLIYLWGPAFSGKTHLLNATRCRINDLGFTSALVSLEKQNTLLPDALERINASHVVCIDNLHLVAGQTDWEMVIFNLYNHIIQNHTSLIITASQSPSELAIKLADLKSRLSACIPFYLHPLTDEEKILALKLRANKRGFSLPDQVAAYLLNHFDRNLHHLFKLLDRLDHASLSQHKKLSIPFMKQALSEMNAANMNEPGR